ncbi:MAG: phosphoribosylanthranilate isomerase [Phycisphaerales bacterium]|jgi:phosphoribosylanthranilate isomerase|nr:phosphoribosylanthranilate isomerase [Phycisphaerales bacterium]
MTHPRPRIKICCIASVEEAQLAIRHGASAIGLVSAMPSGPGPIPEDKIAEIAATIPPGVATFLLTCLDDPEQIIAQQRRTRVNTIQLCDRIRPADYATLRAAMPGIALVQVIHVTGPESVEEALKIAPHVDALLLDSGNQSLPVKELGGTGRVHDWSLSERIVKSVPRPVYLAGGLKPENVAEAIRRVRPFGLDVCSGLRTNGALDESKVSAFFAAVNRAHGA